MPDSVTGASSSSSVANATQDNSRAFRQADFLKIMLAEVTSQSPFDPQDTGKMVENMQKLQELANTTYAKYRSDVTWAQQLMGQTINVQQQALDPAALEKAVNKGLRPDVGYGNVSGTVTSFKTVDETVYVTVNDKDYPVDNIKQIVPQSGGTTLAGAASAALGRQVTWINEAGAVQRGVVSEVTQNRDGQVSLRVGNLDVPFKDVLAIGVVQP